MIIDVYTIHPCKHVHTQHIHINIMDQSNFKKSNIYDIRGCHGQHDHVQNFIGKTLACSYQLESRILVNGYMATFDTCKG